MKIVQKIIFISALFISVAYFIYTLSFSTQWALGEDFGDFFVNAQAANQQIFKLGLWTLVLMGGNMLMNSHSNLRFYPLNFLFAIPSAALMFYSGFITVQLLPPLKEAFLQLDPMLLMIITSLNYSEINTSVFDIGTVLSYMMIIESILVLLLTVFKLAQQVIRAKAKKARAGEMRNG